MGTVSRSAPPMPSPHRSHPGTGDRLVTARHDLLSRVEAPLDGGAGQNSRQRGEGWGYSVVSGDPRARPPPPPTTSVSEGLPLALSPPWNIPRATVSPTAWC